MNRESPAFRLPIFCLGIALAAAGCSRSDRPELAEVEGMVTLDGQPLPDALVLFTPEGQGRTSQALTDAEGRYRLAYLRDIVGANVGPHHVRIRTATEEAGGKERLPPKYHAKSVLTATVAPGENVVDFPLSSR